MLRKVRIKWKTLKINLNQDVNVLRKRWKDAFDEVGENAVLEFMLNNLASEITVGECYECFKVIKDQIKDSYNIAITEIVKEGSDYIIKGIGMEDEIVELKFSETEFWIH